MRSAVLALSLRPSLLAACACATVGCADSASGVFDGFRPALTPREPSGHAAATLELFTPPVIDVYLRLSPKAWQALMDVKAACGRRNCAKDAPEWEKGLRREQCPQYDTYVKADFWLGTRLDTSGAELPARTVGVRLKGLPRDWGCGHKEQFIIRFNRVFPDPEDPTHAVKGGGAFRGLKRLNLEANSSDDGLVRNNLAMGLMREAGVLASLTNHARLMVDVGLGERYLGIYEHIEHVDKRFIEARFGWDDGNLYEGDGELKTNEKAGDRSDFETLLSFTELVHALGDVERAVAELPLGLDVDRTLRLLAVEALLPTSDNFWSDGTNFYLYHDPWSGFVPLPWDLDDVLGRRDSQCAADLESFLVTDGHDRPAAALGARLWDVMRAHEPWRRRFLAVLREVAEEHYRPMAEPGGRVDQLCATVLANVTSPAGIPVATPDAGFQGDEYALEPDDVVHECELLEAHIRCRADAAAAWEGR